MLRTRVITALVIAVVLFPAVFFLNQALWAYLTALIIGVAAWEFARLGGFCPAGRIRFGASIAALTVLLAVFLPADLFAQASTLSLGLSVLFWIGVIPFWLRARRKLQSHLAFALVGVIVLVPTWFALIDLWTRGALWLIAAIGLVALADIAAYFFGRAFGRRKLAPNISPGKSWEGAWGAMFTVTVFVLLLDSWMQGWNSSRAIVIILFMPLLTLVSIAGDLFESMLKRQAGVKDSSNLLPGHGGVLDRIDSHTAALPLIALLLRVIH